MEIVDSHEFPEGFGEPVCTNDNVAVVCECIFIVRHTHNPSLLNGFFVLLPGIIFDFQRKIRLLSRMHSLHDRSKFLGVGLIPVSILHYFHIRQYRSNYARLPQVFFGCFAILIGKILYY